MPYKVKPPTILVYCKDEKEKRKIKILAAKNGQSMNELLLSPFREVKNI